jgi:hypothetical protein
VISTTPPLPLDLFLLAAGESEEAEDWITRLQLFPLVLSQAHSCRVVAATAM